MPRCVRVHAVSLKQKGKKSLGFSLMHFFRVSYVNEECERENLKRRHKKKGSRGLGTRVVSRVVVSCGE